MINAMRCGQVDNKPIIRCFRSFENILEITCTRLAMLFKSFQKETTLLILLQQEETKTERALLTTHPNLALFGAGDDFTTVAWSHSRLLQTRRCLREWRPNRYMARFRGCHAARRGRRACNTDTSRARNPILAPADNIERTIAQIPGPSTRHATEIPRYNKGARVLPPEGHTIQNEQHRVRNVSIAYGRE